MSIPPLHLAQRNAWQLAVVSAAVAFSGCSATGSYVAPPSFDIGSMTRISTLSAEKQRLAAAVNALAFNEATAMARVLQRDPDLGPQVDIRHAPVAAGAVIDYAYQSPEGFFPVGKYSLTDVVSHGGRSELAYAVLVNDSVKNIVNQAEQLGVPVCLDAQYVAGADGLPTSARSIYYGELGDVVSVTKANTLLNGVPTDISIQKGQRFDNPQLAALRAVSMRNFFRAGIHTHGVKETFDLKVSRSVGSAYRHVKLRVLIRTDGAGCGE